MISQIDRITINPDVCNGKPVVRGLRITVESILDYLSAGETAEEISRQHPMHTLNGHPRACPEDPALRGGQAGKQGRHRAAWD